MALKRLPSTAILLLVFVIVGAEGRRHDPGAAAHPRKKRRDSRAGIASQNHWMADASSSIYSSGGSVASSGRAFYPYAPATRAEEPLGAAGSSHGSLGDAGGSRTQPQQLKSSRSARGPQHPTPAAQQADGRGAMPGAASYPPARSGQQDAETTRKRGAPPPLAPPPRPCKRLMWWTAVALQRGRGYQEHPKYLLYLSAAIMSARANAPSLEPHLIYSGPVEPWFLAWWEQQGGKLHQHELSFMGELKRLVERKEKNEGWLDNYGAFLRLDLHLLVNRSSVPSYIEDEMVLYTDADVLFLKDIDSCSVPRPKILAIGGEVHKNEKFNSGVMFINTTAMAHHHYGLLAWGIEKKFPGAFDQDMIRGYFALDDLDQLNETFNWKGYWGGSSDAKIAHWHGPKPMRGLECLVAADLQDLDLDKACPELPEVYRLVFSLNPDGGKFYAVLMMEWAKHTASYTLGQMQQAYKASLPTGSGRRLRGALAAEGGNGART